jgi:hypothetical protein
MDVRRPVRRALRHVAKRDAYIKALVLVVQNMTQSSRNTSQSLAAKILSPPSCINTPKDKRAAHVEDRLARELPVPTATWQR